MFYWLFLISGGVFCFQNTNFRDYGNNKVEYQKEIESWLTDIDSNLSVLNSIAAHLSWELSTSSDEKTFTQVKEIVPVKNKWKNAICESNIMGELLTEVQRRKLYLLCRGVKYTNFQIANYMQLLEQLAEAYNSNICFPKDDQFLRFFSNNTNIYPGTCVRGELNFERLMTNKGLFVEQLRWAWLTWHDNIGPKIRPLFEKLVVNQNIASIQNGYHDLGDVWREELEIENLEKVVMNLYKEIEPLYVMLHAVVRYKLYQKYGPLVLNLKGLIPIHLLGNLWAQDWSQLINIILPEKYSYNINFDERLRKLNITMKDMVLKAEDFYVSLGFPKMTEAFWKYSVFEETENITSCHGSAANMFVKGDYRILTCGKSTMNDFYVIHHEMGHIVYYMASSCQPTIFQESVNSALHESIGDAIWLGVMTPQHLSRLNILSDLELADTNVEFYLLLYQALQKIPELPFALIMDIYRWRIYDGTTKFKDLNRIYWEMTHKLRGIEAPDPRSENYFDAGAKFHVPDNTPYMRYFLSNIIKMDIFKSFCEINIYGRNKKETDKKINLPLHKCDIYGSAKAGKHLKKMMEKGSSLQLHEAIKLLTGSSTLSTGSLMEYYKPIYSWLKQYIKKYNIITGW